MSNRRTAIVVVFTLLLPTLSIAADTPEKLNRAMACYAVVLGPWKPDLELREDHAWLVLPKQIQLIHDLYLKPGINDSWHRVRIIQGDSRSAYQEAYWYLLENDFLGITFTTGFSGVRATVAYERFQMSGTAATFWDVVGRETQEASVTLRRVACASK